MSQVNAGTDLPAKLQQKLAGVHPALVNVITLAWARTQGFGISEGLRSKAHQLELVDAGASLTMNSRHLTGHAVDLFPLVAGRPRWDWALFYPLAAVIQEAAAELGVGLTWGGVWDRPLASLTDMEEEVAQYVARRKAKGKKAFIDGPHFELSKEDYPA